MEAEVPQEGQKKRFCSNNVIVVAVALAILLGYFVYHTRILQDNICEVKCNTRNCKILSDAESCKCPEGTKRLPRTDYCEDIDECRQTPPPCPDGATCKNTVRSYECVCKSGYENLSGECVDIDECDSDEPVCGPQGKCTNAPGTYHCECPAGYTHADAQAPCVAASSAPVAAPAPPASAGSPPAPPAAPSSVPAGAATSPFRFLEHYDMNPHEFRTWGYAPTVADAAQECLNTKCTAFVHNGYDGKIYLKTTEGLTEASFRALESDAKITVGILAADFDRIVPESMRAKFSKA